MAIVSTIKKAPVAAVQAPITAINAIQRKLDAGAPAPAPALALAPPPASAPAPAAIIPKPEFTPPTLEHSAVDKIAFDRTGVNQTFDAQRAKAAATEAQALQGQKEAMARRSAQLSGGPTGALLKQEGIASNASAQRLEDANQNINAGQAAELQRLSEAETTLNAQRADAAAGRDLSKYSTDLSAMTNRYGVDTQTAQAEAARAAAANQFNKTFDYTQAQDAKEFAANSKQNAIATIENLKTNGYTPEQIGAILHSVGLDQLGVEGLSVNDITGVTKAAAPATAAPANYAQSVAASPTAPAGVRMTAMPTGGSAQYKGSDGVLYNYVNGAYHRA